VKASIVIPALNEERHLGGLLSDLAAQTRPPDEVLVVDAGSTDCTLEVARRFPQVKLFGTTPPVARGRNLGGRKAGGDVVVFFDADVRIRGDFLEGLLGEMERRRLDVACPAYVPNGDADPAVRAFHVFFNAIFKAVQGIAPSGAGHCIAVRGELFRGSRGFDPGLKFDDIELVRRLSRGRRFGVVGEKVYVSDRRYREDGTLNTFMRHLLMSVFFALGKFEWANRVEYEFGKHTS
jgi:glycosyltransferase involved in cell wall biosynthesis